MNVRVNGIRHSGEEVARGRSLWLWCPGCDGAHRVQVAGEDGSRPDGPVWEWDHGLKGQTVPMVPLPDWLANEEDTT